MKNIEKSLESTGSEFRPAGFWIRFLAIVVDGVLLVPVYILLSFLPLAADAIKILGKVITGFLYFAYVVWTTGKWGQTLGKKVVGIKVIQMNGDRVTYDKSVERFLASIISAIILNIGFIMAAFTQYKRALHDKMVDTRVVYILSPTWGRVLGVICGTGVAYVLLLGVYTTALLKSPRLRAQALSDGIHGLKTQNRVNHLYLNSLRDKLKKYSIKHKDYPNDLNLLVAEGLLAKVPKLILETAHSDPGAFQTYGPDIFTDSGEIIPIKLKDTGTWGYISAKGSPHYGKIFVDCTHNDSDGKPWYSY